MNNLTQQPNLPLPAETAAARAFAERVRANQQQLAANLRPHYDFIVCGAGSSGSVVARRLAENPAVRVLLLEAGGSDDVSAVLDPEQWATNLNTDRDWGFQAEPNPHLNNRKVPMSMGKVLGGGSSINVMLWARGHRSDWDFYAAEADDLAWGYEAVLGLYRRIENYLGAPDARYRGTDGPMTVGPATNPIPVNLALLDGAESVGLPRFESPNGRLLEGSAGCAPTDLFIHNGQRQSVFRSYAYPLLDQSNLTVLTGALVTRITFEGKKATGVEISYQGKTRRVAAGQEVVLSLGAIETPKLLMQSGLGDEVELTKFGIPLVQHLPGVGRHMQDHPGIGCIWECQQPLNPTSTLGQAVAFWPSEAGLAAPNLMASSSTIPLSSPETLAKYALPQDSWTLFMGLVRPQSRGQVRLSGPQPTDPPLIQPNYLSHPDDLKALTTGLEVCRAIGNSAALRPFWKREIMPGNLQGPALEDFVRTSAATYWHQTCTAKMGRDEQAVVDNNLKVYGIENLRVADGSILPRITTGNTTAPCVVIGERAGDILKARHGL